MRLVISESDGTLLEMEVTEAQIETFVQTLIASLAEGRTSGSEKAIAKTLVMFGSATLTAELTKRGLPVPSIRNKEPMTWLVESLSVLGAYEVNKDYQLEVDKNGGSSYKFVRLQKTD